MVTETKAPKGWNKCSKCGKSRTFNNKQLKLGRDLSRIGDKLICDYCMSKIIAKVAKR